MHSGPEVLALFNGQSLVFAEALQMGMDDEQTVVQNHQGLDRLGGAQEQPYLSVTWLLW
jgi:hypothetical protein